MKKYEICNVSSQSQIFEEPIKSSHWHCLSLQINNNVRMTRVRVWLHAWTRWSRDRSEFDKAKARGNLVWNLTWKTLTCLTLEIWRKQKRRHFSIFVLFKYFFCTANLALDYNYKRTARKWPLISHINSYFFL